MHGTSLLAFESVTDPPGIEVIDQVERLRYRMHTTEGVSPSPVPTDGLVFPVDSAVSITTGDLVLPAGKTVCVRDTAGEMLSEVGHLEETTLGDGPFILELGAQIKTYIEASGPIEVSVDLVETRISFARPQSVVIGAVSSHDRPAATVTTTPDPVDMMRALTTLGSALKTADPERSFPSNRGHPPAIRVGDTVDIPDTIERPETGIRLEIPATYEAVYTTAPLAYYLGAEVVRGETPRLVTETGGEYRLDSPAGLEQGVERILKQVFLLDCVTRTEGVYDVELRERNDLEHRLDIDWARLYDRPLTEQVETYLEVPHAVIADRIPEWRLTVHVEPDCSTIEQLPFVIDDLAIVKLVDSPTRADVYSPDPDRFARNDLITRSAVESSGESDGSYVTPQDDSSLEQAWIGDSIPVGASKLTVDAFRNRFGREATAGDISITIVLNDPRMAEESDTINRAYGDRDDLPCVVRAYRNLTVEQLRDRLREECSFFHYVGHTERDGIECTDGKLDVSTLETTGVESFLLNSCNSYEQGLRLIESGAIGGIVTLNDVINEGAVRIGETVARLLNAGFPLRAALNIAREETFLGGQYIVVGDGGMTVTQAASRTPNLLELSATDGRYDVTIKTYATDEAGLGSLYKPHISGNDEYFLSSGTIASFNVDREELFTFLELENVPVRYEGDLYWSSSVDITEVD